MFHLSRTTKETVYGALIDISSGSIGVSIVFSEHGKPLPEIIYAHRVEMRITKNVAKEDETLRRVRESLFSACLTLSQEGLQALKERDPHAKISKLFVTCSSPWAYTIARNVRYENDVAFKVTETLIKDLEHGAEEEIISLLHTKPELKDRDFSIVERASVDITINDYPVHEPLHLKGNSMTLSHIAGLIPKEIIDAIQEVQNKLFPNTELRAHTYMLVMYCVLRDVFPKQHSVCIVDVTSEATEFGIVENNLLLENIYIPHGTNSFLRDISEVTGSPISDVCTRLTAEKDGGALIPSDFSTSVEAYEQRIIDALSIVLEHRTLPTEIIITAQQPFDSTFKDMVTRALTKVSGGTALTVVQMDSKVLEEIAHGKTNDTYLEIGARFFHKLHGCGEMESD